MIKERAHGIAGEGKFGTGVGEFITIYTLVDITQTGVVAPYRSDAPAFKDDACLLYTSPSPRDGLLSRMPSSA